MSEADCRQGTVSAGSCCRQWQAWCNFWFKPADPTPLCFMRIVAGVLTIYVHLASSFDLSAFFGKDAWYSREIADRYRRETPNINPELGWQPSGKFTFPLDASQRELLGEFCNRICEDPAVRTQVIAFLSRLDIEPELRNEV